MNPLKIQYSKVPHCILECEFALKFLEDTKMEPGAENKKGNYEIFVSLELVSTRIKPDFKKNLNSREIMFLNVADNGGAGAIVIGDKIQNLDNINLNSIEVEVNLNGKITGAWEKRAHPTEAIKCIVNEFKDNPVTFKKGDWFMTGSIIQPIKINKGDKIISINGDKVKYYKDIAPLIAQKSEKTSKIKPLIMEIQSSEQKKMIEIYPSIFEEYNEYGKQ